MIDFEVLEITLDKYGSDFETFLEEFCFALGNDLSGYFHDFLDEIEDFNSESDLEGASYLLSGLDEINFSDKGSTLHPETSAAGEVCYKYRILFDGWGFESLEKILNLDVLICVPYQKTSYSIREDESKARFEVLRGGNPVDFDSRFLVHVFENVMKQIAKDRGLLTK